MASESGAAQQALKDIQIGRAAAASRVRPTWWFFPAQGLLVAAMGAAVALPLPWISFISLISLTAVLVNRFVLQRLYRAATGVSFDEFRRGLGSGWSVVYLVLAIGSLFPVWAFSGRPGGAWLPLAEAAFLFALTVVHGHVFVRTLRRKLLASPGAIG